MVKIIKAERAKLVKGNRINALRIAESLQQVGKNIYWRSFNNSVERYVS